MPASQPQVLIVGAGLGGLALAQVLRKHQISYQIFERDSGPSSRAQGWAVSLQWILGDLLSSTLRDTPPLQDVSIAPGQPSKFSRWNGSTGECIMSIGSGHDGKAHLRANRQRLREWLETKLDIQWGKHFARYENGPDGIKIFFEDGSSATGDILVGADGINSRVRKQLHATAAVPVRPERLPLLAIVGEVDIDLDQYKHFQELGGSFYLADLPKGRLFGGVKNVTERGAEAYWMFNIYDPEALRDDHWTHSATQQQLLDFTIKTLQAIDPKFTEIVRVSTAERILTHQLEVKDMIPYPIPHGRVTLLGDAVHPMTYFRGEGANHAMQDGLNFGNLLNAELGTAYGLKDGKLDVEAFLKKYEEEMIARSSNAVKESRASAIEMKGYL